MVAEEVNYEVMLRDVLKEALNKTTDLDKATKHALKKIMADAELNRDCLHDLVYDGIRSQLADRRSRLIKQIKDEAATTPEQRQREADKVNSLLGAGSEIMYRSILEMPMPMGRVLGDLTGAEIREELEQTRAQKQGVIKREKLLLAFSNLVGDLDVVRDVVSVKRADRIAQTI